MINFLRTVGNIKLGDYLHQDGIINDVPSSDIIGVCVIPSNILPDNYARFESLRGSLRTWGMGVNLKSEYKIDIPGKDKKSKRWGYLKETELYPSFRIVDPYLPNDSFNPEFLKDLPGGNAFQDYKGYENMKIYKERYIDYEMSNAFLGVIENSPTYRRNDWYLPSIGELAFIPPKFEFISNKESEAFLAGSPGLICDYPPESNFWSSSEWSDKFVWHVEMPMGFIFSSNKSTIKYIRAFLAL